MGYLPFKGKDPSELSDADLERLFKLDPPWRTYVHELNSVQRRGEAWGYPEVQQALAQMTALRKVLDWPAYNRFEKYREAYQKAGKEYIDQNPEFQGMKPKKVKKAVNKYMKKKSLVGQFSLGSTISHGISHDFSEMEEESHDGPFVSYEQRYNEHGEPFKVEVTDYSRAKMDEFLRFTLKYTSEELKYLDRTDYQLISDTLQKGGKVDREFVDNLLFKHGVHGKYNSRAEMMMSDFSEVVSNLYGILTDSPDKEDPTFKYPTYTYGDNPSCQYHLHSDDAKVRDIIVISPYDAGSDGWKQDRDFLSGFMEVSQGTPIGKYEVVSED